MSKSIAPAMFAFILLLTLNLSPSLAVDLDDSDRDYCTTLVASRFVKPDEAVPNEDFYFCHPSIPNAYLKCVVGRPEKSEGKIVSTRVLEEQELVCGAKGFFNTDKKACMPHPLSNCARKFVKHTATDEQRICDAYRLSRPTNYSSVASLICHDKEKDLFVVCPLNTASAVTVPCVNGTYFNQMKGRCIRNVDESDCPIEWKEMEKDINTVGEIRKASSASDCVCKSELAAKPLENAVYIAHPELDNSFLICLRNGQVLPGLCSKGTFWNDGQEACDRVLYRKPVPGCGGLPPAVAMPVVAVPPVVPAATGSHAGGQHECIDCVISERQRCECSKALQLTGRDVMYICDPDGVDRFLVCTGSNVVCQNCAKGTFWNRDAGACGSVRKCDPELCGATPPPATTTKPCIVPKPVITTPKPVITTPKPCFVPKPVITTPKPVITTPKPVVTTPAPTTLAPYVPYCEYFYVWHPEKMNWFSAKRVCEANQGTLATITNLETQSRLRDRYGSTSSSQRYWIGASDRDREGNWQWVTGERFGFTNWYRNQPSMKRDEDCLGFNYYNKGAWSDEDCDQLRSFICQHLVCSK